MARKPDDSPLKTLYRLTVMVGVLACGSMAAYHYGPEADELAEMIDATAGRLGIAVASDQPSAAPLEPAPLLIVDAAPIQPAPLAAEPPRFDPAVQPTAALTPIQRAPAEGVDAIDQQRLVAPVFAAGASQAKVRQWPDGQFRATASVPVGDPASGLERQFDVFESTAEAAATELLRQVQTEAYR